MFEKWAEFIPQNKRPFFKTDVVCSLHFDAGDSEIEDIITLHDGSTYRIERNPPRLRPKSIPYKFHKSVNPDGSVQFIEFPRNNEDHESMDIIKEEFMDTCRNFQVNSDVIINFENANHHTCMDTVDNEMIEQSKIEEDFECADTLDYPALDSALVIQFQNPSENHNCEVPIERSIETKPIIDIATPTADSIVNEQFRSFMMGIPLPGEFWGVNKVKNAYIWTQWSQDLLFIAKRIVLYN